MAYIRKLLFLLNKSEKRSLGILLGMVIIMALIDIAGIASILPFFAVISNSNVVNENRVLIYFYNSFDFNSVQEFSFFLGICVFTLILFSLIFKAFTTYTITRFWQIRRAKITSRLMREYLNQDYTWHLNRNSADLYNIIFTEVPNVVGGGLNALLNFISQGVVAIAILITLFIVDSILAISIGLTFSLIYIIITKTTSGYLQKLGKEKISSDRKMHYVAGESFGAFKEIKLASLEKIYSKEYADSAYQTSHLTSISTTVALMPRFLLEAISICGMILVVLFLLARSDGSLSKVFPILSLYTFAIYRLMPAIQTTYQSITQFRFSIPAIDLVYSEFRKLYRNKSSKKQTDINSSRIDDKLILAEGISLEEIVYSYPQSFKPAIKGINLFIKAKSIVGFVGSTGSGKTTTVDLILGLLKPQKGKIRIDGEYLDDFNIRSWQKNIGYVPQNIYLSDCSIKENIAFGIDKKLIDQSLVERAARIANLHGYVTALETGYETIVGERGIRISGGQRQRIAIARALYNCPDVLILDEATSSLDSITERSVMEAINNLGNSITIILIAHRLSTVRRCDNICLLKNGNIEAEGTFESLQSNNITFQEMLKAQD